MFAVGCAFSAWGTEKPASDEQAKFVARSMRTVALPLKNPEFSETASSSSPGLPIGWKEIAPNGSDFEVKRVDGRNDGHAVSVVIKPSHAENGDPHELYQDIAVQWAEKTQATLSVSAWVWSDRPGGAYLKLSNSKGRDAVSAYHSGGSGWENLTVVYPYDERPDSVRLSLMTKYGKAIYGEVRPIVTYDDRFAKVLPDGCNPIRERVTYLKDGRIRIVVVGNSTVNGHAVADKRGTFPYALQLKLEAYFPGRFEVINFGLCGWHLPPQIMTLDRAFNSNKACDGATWCGGKEGQFTHKNVLVAEQNADRNTPTINQLQPDIIVFAGMWNDVWRVLKYAGWGIPPNPDEVNRHDGVPSSIEYLQAVFNYADQPTEKNRSIADNLFKRAMQPVDPKIIARLQLRDLAALKASSEFGNLEENARKKFRFLAEEFIRRAQKYSNVWTVTLPGRFGDSYEDAGNKMAGAGLLPPEKIDNFMVNGYIDAVTERIQNQELASASQKYRASMLNLSKSFRQQYGTMSIGEQFALGYFLENAEDNVHFRYRGNEWIADQMFLGFSDEFSRLSRLPTLR